MTTPPSFDAQAEDFDRRAGIPAARAAEIAAAVAEIAALRGRGRMLEIGAGTGEIGAHLLALGVDYLALDRSPRMLEVFARRVDPRHHPRLVSGDADRRWPVGDGELDAIFLSRVAHLLDPRTLWSEAQRTAGPAGARLLVGRRARDPMSVHARMRRRMHEMLAEAGIPHRGGSGPRRMLEGMRASGGHAPFVVEVARWSVLRRPIEALSAWRSKPGLAGVELETARQAEILDRLADWMRAQFPDPSAEHANEEWYEVHGIHVPSRAPSKERRGSTEG